MGKIKYQFNPKSLAVEPVEEGFGEKFKRFMKVVLGGMVFSIIVLSIGYSFFDSPKERMLQRENDQYQWNYQVLNDRIETLSAVLTDIQHRDDHIYRVIFEADPIPQPVRNAAFGGTDRYTDLEGFDNKEVITQTAKRVDKLSRQLYVQSKSYDEVFEMARNKVDMLASIPAIVPIARGTQRLVSGYGYRIHPVYKTLRMHSGVDFAAPTGTPIYASGNGRVIRAENNRSGYGIMVEINHDYGYRTLYAHMVRHIVEIGQEVVRGEIIGYVGSTGVSTAPHLHYEVIKNGRKVNPVNYFFNDLSPEEFEFIIEVASRVNQSLS